MDESPSNEESLPIAPEHASSAPSSAGDGANLQRRQDSAADDISQLRQLLSLRAWLWAFGRVLRAVAPITVRVIGLTLIVGLSFQVLVRSGVFEGAREKARQVSCLSNVKLLGRECVMYAQEYDDTLPKASHWADRLLPYARNEERALICPKGGAPFSYAFNLVISGRRLSDIASPTEQVVIFESSAGRRNAADPLGSFVFRHPVAGTEAGRASVAYCDGHARSVTEVPPALAPASAVRH